MEEEEKGTGLATTKPRIWATIKTREDYRAQGYPEAVDGSFPSVPGYVNASMVRFGGLRIEWALWVDTISGRRRFAPYSYVEGLMDWRWDEAMLKDIVDVTEDEMGEPDDDQSNIRPEPKPRFVPIKRDMFPDGGRYEALTREIVSAWDEMRQDSGNGLPQDIDEDDAGVQKLVEHSAQAKEEARQMFHLDDLLRARIEFTCEPEDILRNEPLRQLWREYLRQWLYDGGYDPETSNLATNTIDNKKGQSMKLTRVLARVMPEEVPHSALVLAQEISQTRKTPTRDSFLALVSVALRGGSTFTLSANPSDFITSSFGGGFSSCHGPGDIHFAGNIGLATTRNVLLAYTGTPEEKTGRMWVWYDPDMPQVWQLKSYGIFPGHWRKAVREYIEQCLHKGTWVHRSSPSMDVLDNTTRGYFDHCGCDAAYVKGNKYSPTLRVRGTIGSFCIKCGDSDVQLRSALCRSCAGEYHQCYDCGGNVDEDDGYLINGDWYCPDCVSYCDSCGDNHVRISYTVYTRNAQGWTADASVCEDCLDRYTLCDDCGECWDNNFVMGIHNGDKICVSCYENNGYSTCDECGDVFPDGDCEIVKNGCYCTTCAEAVREDEAV